MQPIYQRSMNVGTATIDRLRQHQRQQEIPQAKSECTATVSGQFDNAPESVPITGQFDDADTRSDDSCSISAHDRPGIKAENQEQTDNIVPLKSGMNNRRNRGFKRMVTRSPSPPPCPKRCRSHLPKAEDCTHVSKVEDSSHLTKVDEVRKPCGLDFLASAVAVESAGLRMEECRSQGSSGVDEEATSQRPMTSSNVHVVPQPPDASEYPKIKQEQAEKEQDLFWGSASALNNSPSNRPYSNLTSIHARPHPIPPMPESLRTSAVHDTENSHKDSSPSLSKDAPVPAMIQIFTPATSSNEAPRSTSLPSVPPAMIPCFTPGNEFLTSVNLSQQNLSSPCVFSSSVKHVPSKLVSTFNVPPSPANITTITQHDVMFGRGGGTNKHPGNREFRELVDKCRAGYLEAKKMQKATISRLIVQTIRYKNPPGRFLKKDEKTNMFYEVGDRKAAEKTSQALREGIAHYSSTVMNKEAEGQAKIIVSDRLLPPLSPTTVHIQKQLRQIQDEHESAISTAKDSKVCQRNVPPQPIENQPWIISSIVPISVKRRFGSGVNRRHK